MASYKRKHTGEELHTLTVRLSAADLARLDGLVEKGYAAPIDEVAYYVPANRGAAVREAIRDAAVRKRVSVPKAKPKGRR